MKQPEENYRLLFETMNEGYALYEIVYDEFRNPVDYIVVDFNPAFESLTGLKREEAIGQKASLLYRNTRPPHPEVFARVADTGEPAYFETYFPVVQKHFGISVFSPGKGRLATLFSDVSERKQSEEELKRDEARLESLLKLSEYKSTDVKGLLDFALDEAIQLTGSRAGYIYFYDEAQKEFALNTWAENGIEECQISNPQTVRQLENTSMWGEVVRQRKPIVRNDYRSSRPLKKGYPEGHVELERFLAVPVFIRDKVAAVAGVANKPSAYLQSDIRQLTLLMDTVWEIVEHRKAERALLESEEHFRTLVEKSPVPMAVYNDRLQFELVNDCFAETFGYTFEDIPDIDAWWKKAYPEESYRRQVISRWRNAREKGVPFQRGDGLPEFRITCKDGSERTANVSRTIIGDRYLIAFTDITESKRLEVDLQQGLQKLNIALRGVIDATAKMVEMRDPYTGGHQQRVARLSAAIAEEMGYSREQVMYIGMAGMVHDIGKIYIPAEILSRTGRLSDLEYRFVKTHVAGSYDILKTIEFPWPIARIVLQHHERMDGSGYPAGLQGDEILPEARILAVADTVEAMSSHRPYRPSLGAGEALEEISGNRGKLYDAQVVEACINLFLEKGFRFEEPSAAGPEELTSPKALEKAHIN